MRLTAGEAQLHRAAALFGRVDQRRRRTKDGLLEIALAERGIQTASSLRGDI